MPASRISALVCAALAMSATRSWSATNGDIDDSVAQRWQYSEGNARMKAGHKEVRRWKAAFDSARQEVMADVYGKAASPSPAPVAARAAAAAVTPAPLPLGTEHEFAGGRISGHWVLNRVSNTTAKGGYGSGVRLDRTAYDSAANTIHALTEEGNLVSAPLSQMASWRVVNQVVQIDKPSFVGVRTPAGGFRLLGIISGGFRFSDDQGATWTDATGGASSNGTSAWTAVLGTGEILAVVRRNTLDVLIRSVDRGVTFQDVQTWPYSSASAVVGTRLYNTSDVCILLRKRESGSTVDVHRYSGGTLATLGSFTSTSKPTSLTGTMFAGAMRIYAHTADKVGWSSTDGSTWKSVAGVAEDLQTVLPDQPDVVISNGAQHETSKDGGNTWVAYPDNNSTIGWDPKHVAFYKVAGKWTLVAANDMGLCFNDDPLNTATWKFVNSNHSFAILHGGIAVDNQGLTVTSNQDPGTFELTRTGRDTMLAKNRSGADGLRAAATNGGKAYWYRHYWASFMHAHAAFTSDTRTASYDVDGDWYTPPFKGSTKPGEDAIWVSGWNKLFKLTYVAASNTITRTDLPKDFQVEAGDVTWGVAVAKSDPNRLYVATKNGKFFASKDAGQTWTESSYSGAKPTSQWAAWNSSSGLYIEVADKDPDLVFWGGGTGAPACLVSRDGGKTFVSTVSGMPSGSEVRNVSIAPSGKLAFSSNFQVWIASDNRWYDLRTASMPSAALPAANALQYLPLQRKVRYFTWGAGVVDLDISRLDVPGDSEVVVDGNSCYQLRSASSGKSLTATAAGKVVQASFAGSANQTWRFTSEGGFHRVENTGTGKVLEVTTASYKDAAPVGLGPWSGGDHQLWNLVKTDSGIGLIARHSVKALEIASASVADSAKADQGTDLGSAHQRWVVQVAATCGTTPIRRGLPSDRLSLVPAGKGLYRIAGMEESSAHALAWDLSGRIAWRGDVSGTLDLSRLGRGVYRVRIWSDHLDVTLPATVVP